MSIVLRIYGCIYLDIEVYNLKHKNAYWLYSFLDGWIIRHKIDSWVRPLMYWILFPLKKLCCSWSPGVKKRVDFMCKLMGSNEPTCPIVVCNDWATLIQIVQKICSVAQWLRLHNFHIWTSRVFLQNQDKVMTHEDTLFHLPLQNIFIIRCVRTVLRILPKLKSNCIKIYKRQSRAYSISKKALASGLT